MVAFLSPDLLELMRDFIMSGKGDQFKITKPDWLPQYATEEFLYHHGYAQQVHEIRVKRREKNGKAEDGKVGLDYLTEDQRHAVVVLMNHRDLTEEQATKMVLSHPSTLEKALKR